MGFEKEFYEEIRALEKKYNCKFDVISNIFYLNEDLSDVQIAGIKKRIETLIFRYIPKIRRFGFSRISDKNESKLNKKKKPKIKEPFPEYKNNPLKRWSDLTIFIDCEKDKNGNWTNWKNAYYSLNPKKVIPLTITSLNSLYTYYIRNYHNTDRERKRKSRMNADLIAWFNKQNKSIPIDEHYEIGFNIEIRELYKEHKERIGKDKDITDWNL